MVTIPAELETTIAFIQSIGITVQPCSLEETTFLPGLELGPNTIYVDFEKLKYPGDVLHEAGHIAVTPASERQLIGTSQMPDSWPTPGDEMAAILWSYAAVTHLKLPVEFVFHENGYKNGSQSLISNFTSGNFIGLSLLQWFKMASKPEDSIQHTIPQFPQMLHWMRPD